jgi:hypothetical protein
MIRKFDIVKGQREYTVPITMNMDYCVSGSGVFTIEVLDGDKEVYGLVLRDNHVVLPKFSKNCQMRLKAWDLASFTIFVSDSRMIGE